MRSIFVLAAGYFLLAGCTAGDEPSSDAPVETEEQPAQSVRFATYNVYLNRPTQGVLIADLTTPDNPQAQKVAEIIQRVAPDILLLNEFDYDDAGEGLRLFRENYLEQSQNGATPAYYPHVFAAPSNTGTASGHDLDRDGVVTTEPGSRAYGGDAFGYGEFPGQYAMAILSKYPIDEEAVRSFQKFRWKDMPGASLPDDPATPEPNDWYSAEALEEFRLSSKSHWDVPVIIDEKIVHVLAAHPTPPGFDGAEDRNGKRNHDEIKLLADYLTAKAMAYIYDDKGEPATLPAGARFVIMGDLNADPHDGSGIDGAIDQLLASPFISAAAAPTSTGGVEQAQLQAGANLTHEGPPSEDTADFNDTGKFGIGNLHLDFVLFSKVGFREEASGIFWPGPEDPFYDLVGPGFPVESSDHRLVWRDLVLTED